MPDFRMCRKCSDDYFMDPPVHSPDGGITYTCQGDHAGAGPEQWTEFPPAPKGTRGRAALNAGVTADLLAPLLTCFSDDEPWLEYGVVEDRLRKAAPAVFAGHVEAVGHIMFGSLATNSSASKCVAMALRSLESQGHLRHVFHPATGAAWKGRDISHWRPVSAPTTSARLTWSDYRSNLALCDGWTDDDTVGLRSPTQNH